MPSEKHNILAQTRPKYAGSLQDVSGVLAALMIGALVVGQLTDSFVPFAPYLTWIAALAAVSLALVRIGSIQPIAQIFAVGACLVAAAIVVLHPEAIPDMKRALFQGTAFSAFLTSLGLIRAPVRASHVIRVAAARLFAYPPKLQNAAMTFGAQALSVLFNIGTIGMMSDIASDHASRTPHVHRTTTNLTTVTLAALRGTIMMTVWNPIGVGFAIVTSAIPALDPVKFLGLSFLAAALVSFGGVIVFRSEAQEKSQIDHPVEPSGSGDRALLAILVAVATMITLTLVLHRLLDVSFLVAACLVLPLLAALWPYFEPSIRTDAPRKPVDILGEASASMANEATIFLAAAVIGSGVTIVLSDFGLVEQIENGTLPMLAIILACLIFVPVAGALMIPHSIVMIMAAQLLGSGPVGQAHPYALALSLCLAWAMAISASPISAMSIITARSLGISPTRVTFTLNRGFTLYGLLVATVLITLTYILE
jgi:hypothetical protein